MRHFTQRSPLLLVAGLLVALSACSDSGSISAPDESASTLGHTATTSADTVGTAGVPFTPASTINLAVTVGAAVAGQDTLKSTPLTNAKVTVFSRTYVTVPGGRADSLTVSETAVASKTTDASGKAQFDGLPAAQYRVEAVGSGAGAGTASVTIVPPYPQAVNVRLIIRP